MWICVLTDPPYGVGFELYESLRRRPHALQELDCTGTFMTASRQRHLRFSRSQLGMKILLASVSGGRLRVTVLGESLEAHARRH